MLWEGNVLGSALRHLYLAPALWSALRAGAAAGGFSGLMAGLLQAPLVLPAIERVGVRGGALDAIVSIVMPALLGVVAGHVRDQARAGTRRLDSLLAMQRELGSARPLAERLEAVAEGIRRCLGAHQVGLVVATLDGAPIVAGSAPGLTLRPRSPAAWVLACGVAVRSRDLDGDPRLALDDAHSPAPRRGGARPRA
jgi:hypothetical protein